MKGLIAARQEERQADSKLPRAISARYLKMLNKSAASLKNGLCSAPIDLSALRKAYVDRATKRPKR
jgi:hypothetical protein